MGVSKNTDIRIGETSIARTDIRQKSKPPLVIIPKYRDEVDVKQLCRALIMVAKGMDDNK